MHAKIGPYEGERLQRLLRQGSNPVTVRRAEILLESGLGARVEDLAKRYHIPESYLKDLISEFNMRGMAAVTAGVRKKRTAMVPEEISILIELIEMPPEAVGLREKRWTASLLRETALARRWVDVADPEVIEKLLAQHSH
ncbi:MAG: hypothetical protein IMX00_06505 [Limnochordales bacterium]|nr:hypothetical protein [Limnochordales bacterium]MBE3577325.1 hypothetical protein [Limnochordales bacterium]